MGHFTFIGIMILGLVFFVLWSLATKHEQADHQMDYLTDKEKELMKYQKRYLRLINNITKLQLSGQNPSEELLKEAQTVGRLGEIPEAFFKTFQL